VLQGPKLDRDKLGKAAVGNGEAKSLRGFRRKTILVEVREYLITELEISADPIQLDSSASDEKSS
jgi:hypothetical protein